MKTFNLELRVQSSGSVLAWDLYLESTSLSAKVRNWFYDANKECFIKKLDNYFIQDNLLDVFVGSEGKVGGKTTCTVYINEVEQSQKITSNNTDPNYAHQSYSL